MDERNRIGKSVRCNCSDTSCSHPSRVQKWSVATLRGGKSRQAAQRLLCASLCPANSRGTCFPYQHAQCRKGTQRPVGKAVLAKRKASAVALVRQQHFMQLLAGAVACQYARAFTQPKSARRSATFRFFGLFLFVFGWLILPVPPHFLIRRVLLRRSASFYVSRF